ncbi:transcription factor HES-4-B-like [Daphnia pulex]|uniref:transcription factor HES-4-B-like n=1 Tax=Daphnia pulex TaxID=6669 RepID=UPI001EE08E48|nr:transcription factor HES-4-B-like [Daphnia pulex]
MTAKSDKNLKSSRSDKRRTNKPLMEKRRRARINHSLSVLKSLIIKDEANSSNPASQSSRLEKADILELTVMHLRTLEKEKEEHLQQQKEQSELTGKESNKIDNDVKSYRLGYQACCHDIGRFLDGPVSDLTKERLMEHLQERKQKIFQPNNNGDPADANLITPTRLSDGRLALIFSSSCSWLSGGMDLQSPSSSSSSSSSPSSSFQSNPVPATPPSSPDQQVMLQPSTNSVGSVWRPWF